MTLALEKCSFWLIKTINRFEHETVLKDYNQSTLFYPQAAKFWIDHWLKESP